MLPPMSDDFCVFALRFKPCELVLISEAKALLPSPLGVAMLSLAIAVVAGFGGGGAFGGFGAKKLIGFSSLINIIARERIVIRRDSWLHWLIVLTIYELERREGEGTGKGVGDVRARHAPVPHFRLSL